MIDLAAEAPGNTFSWSASRHDTFDSCARKYALSYYGINLSPEVLRLKGLSGLPLWGGHLVHDFAEVYLKNNDTLVGEAAQEDLIRRITHGQMPQDWEISKAGVKKFRLFEHEYSTEVSQRDKEILVGQVVVCIRNWFRSEVVNEMYQVGKSNWLSVEDLVSFSVDGVTVNGRMDAAYRRPDGTVRIVDWKTGKSVGKTNRFQVGGYALFAFGQGWASKPEDIETMLAYLVVPKYPVEKMTTDDLREVRAKIVASAAAMKAPLLDIEKNIGRVGDFAQTKSQWSCKRCQFQRVCFP